MAALLVGPAAMAQEAPADKPAERAETPATVRVATMAVGVHDFDLDAAEAVQACVTGAGRTLDADTRTVRVFVREGADVFLAQPEFETNATGALAGSAVGDCFALNPTPEN